MPKQSPTSNALDKPFYDACNEERLVVQYCTDCRKYQFPPQPTCGRCGNEFRSRVAAGERPWPDCQPRGGI